MVSGCPGTAMPVGLRLLTEGLRRAEVLLACDTASLLGILRSPVEGPKAVSERTNARSLLARVEMGKLAVLAPERVFVELKRNRDRLVRDARESLVAYRKNVRAVQKASCSASPWTGGSNRTTRQVRPSSGSSSGGSTSGTTGGGAGDTTSGGSDSTGGAVTGGSDTGGDGG